MTIESIAIRTTAHGVIVIVLTDDDKTYGLEGVGDDLAEALYDLAEKVEETIDDVQDNDFSTNSN